MIIKLDNGIIRILCCPLCKGAVEILEKKFICTTCKTGYNRQLLTQKRHLEYIFDFRIHRPDYCIPDGIVKWSKMQEIYETLHRRVKSDDNIKRYLDEIDSVREIYSEEFYIKGKILDVGGGKGTLRHFLKKDASLYVSVDPYLKIFQNLEFQPNLLKAYPCLLEPCNFLLSYAENLPFKKNSFDWVHMRSVLDHFYDPYLALKEAYRVLKNNGVLLIGLSVQGGRATENKRDINSNFLGCIKETTAKITNRGKNKIVNDHMFHWQYEDLLDLLQVTMFKVVKKYWQKPPFTNCIYISAKKI